MAQPVDTRRTFHDRVEMKTVLAAFQTQLLRNLAAIFPRRQPHPVSERNGSSYISVKCDVPFCALAIGCGQQRRHDCRRPPARPGRCGWHEPPDVSPSPSPVRAGRLFNRRPREQLQVNLAFARPWESSWERRPWQAVQFGRMNGCEKCRVQRVGSACPRTRLTRSSTSSASTSL